MTLLSGTRLGPYEILGAIGAGGMGEVYRARDTRLGREVAVKVLPTELSEDADRLRRFEREARLAGSLNHPNVLTVHDFGSHEGAPFLVTELLEGRSLREVLANGPLPTRKAVEIAQQIARGLAAAHAREIAHRDLKPANVFVTRDGRVEILDFGLAKLASLGLQGAAGSEVSTQSAEGRIVGTVGYMAPEQVRGQAVDARTDIFALGVVLYEMLTGERAFRGDTTADTLSAILTRDPEEMSRPGRAIPPALDRLVRRCLEKDPEERFQSARDVAFALDAASGTAPSAPLPPEVTSARRRWSGTRAALVFVGGVALVAIGLLLGRSLWERPLPRITQLTARRGQVDVARWTADGQTIVYSAFWDGRPSEIYTVRVESPESRSLGLPPARLMSVSSRGELAILLRPDGEFVSDQELGTLARVPLAGGTPRPILEDVRAADWSPDGQDLAVIRRVDGEEQLEFPIGTVLDRPIAGRHLRISPRGDRVAVGHLDGITVYDAAGTKSPVSAPPAIWGMAWASNDALWIVGGRMGTRSVWLAKLTGPPREAYRSTGLLYMQDASENGRLLVHHGYDRLALRVMPPGRAELEIGLANMHMVADLSDDGTRLLFSTYGTERDATFLWSADGGRPVRLGEGHGVALSPNARWAVTRPASPRVDALPLSLTPTGPGATRTLPLGRLERATAWFLNEERLVIDGNEPGRDSRAYILDLAVQEPRPVTPEGVVSVRRSAWAETLLGVAADGTLARYPIAGGEPRPLAARVPSDRRILRASGDGRYLFVDRAAVPRPVERLDLETGSLSPFKLLRPDDLAGVTSFLGIVLSADGEAHAYHHGRYLQDLYLIEGLPF